MKTKITTLYKAISKRISLGTLVFLCLLGFLLLTLAVGDSQERRHERERASLETRLSDRNAQLKSALALSLLQQQRLALLNDSLRASERREREAQIQYLLLANEYEKKIAAHHARSAADIARLLTERHERHRKP